ncbi:MAG: hypothetical protein KKB81_07715 [Candidatus Margulisbacteria bacterium]|nr:hypothetical protein [Candidatus Margulisiibacteriota bacterium]MBU1021235.1 hypothetical protein [Candidatus Margulisiibacteriota bacterium]MBU1729841.1 hypothetical protein [Candidatus Margulisiibacteriota bacterium]MBU1955342.1 hypothetical protein [Candidatus Margulisiibacteriota bacterium]
MDVKGAISKINSSRAAYMVREMARVKDAGVVVPLGAPLALFGCNTVCINAPSITEFVYTTADGAETIYAGDTLTFEIVAVNCSGDSEELEITFDPGVSGGDEDQIVVIINSNGKASFTCNEEFQAVAEEAVRYENGVLSIDYTYASGGSKKPKVKATDLRDQVERGSCDWVETSIWIQDSGSSTTAGIALGVTGTHSVTPGQNFDLTALLTPINENTTLEGVQVKWLNNSDGNETYTNVTIDGNQGTSAQSFSIPNEGSYYIYASAMDGENDVTVNQTPTTHYVNVVEEGTTSSGCSVLVGVNGPHNVEPGEQFELSATLTPQDEECPAVEDLWVGWANSAVGGPMNETQQTTQSFTINDEGTHHILVYALYDVDNDGSLEDISFNAANDHYVNVIASGNTGDCYDYGDPPTYNTETRTISPDPLEAYMMPGEEYLFEFTLPVWECDYTSPVGAACGGDEFSNTCTAVDGDGDPYTYIDVLAHDIFYDEGTGAVGPYDWTFSYAADLITISGYVDPSAIGTSFVVWTCGHGDDPTCTDKTLNVLNYETGDITFSDSFITDGETFSVMVGDSNGEEYYGSLGYYITVYDPADPYMTSLCDNAIDPLSNQANCSALDPMVDPYIAEAYVFTNIGDLYFAEDLYVHD